MYRFIETLCIENGELKNVEYHNRRMNETRRFFWNDSPLLDVRNFVNPEGYEERTRCRLVYGHEIESVEYFPYTIRPVSSLKLIQDETIDYRFKWADRSVLDRLFAQREQADDVLIVRHGFLTDTSIANIALWNGREWHTPSSPLLNGTHRQRLLNEGLVTEYPIKAGQLADYTHIRLFNAMIEFGELGLSVENVLE